MILVYFPSGECVDDVANNRTNHLLTSVYIVNGKRVLFVPFIKYTLSTFLETKICFVEKNCLISS